MTSVKKIKATDDFLRLPDRVKQCQLGVLEECRTLEFYRRGQDCGCLPWYLRKDDSETLLSSPMNVTKVPLRERPVCTPIGNACFENLTRLHPTCYVACQGIYADVFKVEEGLSQGKIERQDRESFLIMEEQYQKLKESFVDNIHFNASNCEAVSKDYTSLKLVQIFYNTPTYDVIKKDVKISLQAQIGLIGGTLGLFTVCSLLFCAFMGVLPRKSLVINIGNFTNNYLI